MHLLVSNDDGYMSPWLELLVEALEPFGKLSVVAPDHDHSGASNSLTLGRPLRALTMPNGFIRVNGTPADCVHLGITGLLDEMPDLVVSGINTGANLGDDVLYSGTVAAATEGRFLDMPAIAFSMTQYIPTQKETAVEVVRTIMQGLVKKPMVRNTILNVNIPDVSLADLQGYQTTRLGHRHLADPLHEKQDPYGKPIYWIGPAGSPKDGGPGTDFHAIENNYVSVTPMQTDLTHHAELENVSAWLTAAASGDKAE